MTNPLVRKLEAFAPLSESSKRLLDSLIVNVREFGAHEDVVREGDIPGDVYLILEGFACRYKTLEDGGRAIISYLIAGDFCDLHKFVLKTMDHSIGTLTPCQVVSIPNSRIAELTEQPEIARAFWWAELVQEANLREWLVNIGARSAERRVGHLLCELLLRLRWVGLADGDAYEFPITQVEIGNTMGISQVHVNRVMGQLRDQNLITKSRDKVVILDIDKLMAHSGFNPNYLHLNTTA